MTAPAVTAPLMGNQTPRFRSVPPYSVSLGDEAVDFAAKAGLFLDPWQQMVLRESLGMAPGGKWTAPQVAALVPRQNGKGSVLEARELFGMFVLNESLIIHSAHKFDTSQEHFLRMRTLIEGNPDLDRHVLATPTANGKEAIILRNGARLKFKARTVGGSGRGFSADLLVLDEAMLLPEAALDAMLPTLITRKNPQVWFTSSAGTPDSAALWRIVKRGRSAAPRLAYFEWGCDSGVDVLDRKNWADANPGLGYRLSMQALEDDLAQMSEDGFAREHLGMWDDAAAGVFPPGSWEGCADPASQPGPAVTFGVDISVDRASASVGAAGQRQDGLIHVENVLNQPGTDWVTPYLVDVTSKNGGSVVIDPASPAGTLIDELVKANVTVHQVSARDYAQACGAFYDTVRDLDLRHIVQRELEMAVAGARMRDLAGGFAWDRRKPTSDITPLVAVTLATWGYRSFGSGDVLDNIW